MVKKVNFMADTYIQFRADEEDKKEASSILNALGTNLSAVLKMTLKQIIIKKGIPFDVSLPEHSYAVKEAAASLAMEGMPLTEEEKDDLEEFNNMSKEEQEKNIQEIVAKYKAMGMKDAR